MHTYLQKYNTMISVTITKTFTTDDVVAYIGDNGDDNLDNEHKCFSS